MKSFLTPSHQGSVMKRRWTHRRGCAKCVAQRQGTPLFLLCDGYAFLITGGKHVFPPHISSSQVLNSSFSRTNAHHKLYTLITVVVPSWWSFCIQGLIYHHQSSSGNFFPLSSDIGFYLGTSYFLKKISLPLFGVSSLLPILISYFYICFQHLLLTSSLDILLDILRDIFS